MVILYDANKRQLIHESDSDYVKALEPLCNDQLPVWTHMHVNMTFKWIPYHFSWNDTGRHNSEECYVIYSIQRVGPDKEKP